MTHLKYFHETLAAVAAVFTALTVVIPAWRGFAWRFLKAMWFMIRAPFFITDQLSSIASKLETMDERLVNVENDGRFNGGGSSKDMLVRLVNRDRHAFRRMQRPALEMDENGLVMEANDSVVRLFRVGSANECYRRSWQRYLDPEDVDDFKRAFAETTAAFSSFRFAIRIYDSRRDDRGKWEINAWPIDSGKGSKRVYQAEFVPVDEIAKGVAGRNRWTGCACRDEVGE